MPCILSTQKRARLAQAPAPMPVWPSLPNNLVHSIGDRLLASNDIDAYMAFREVCHEWRSITKDDQVKASDETGSVARFEPTKWVLLDRHDDLITLVNLDTGRFLCKRIPLLRKFIFVGATNGGLILLGESVEPYRARVLNPFTGSIAYFKVRIPYEGVRAVVVTTKPPLTVFISTEYGKIMWADQSMETFKHFWPTYPNEASCMTSFGGNVYAIDRYGSIYLSTVAVAAVEPSRRCGMDISMEAITSSLDTSEQGSTNSRYYLVESAGDLLLVTKPRYFTLDQPVVRRVNMKMQTTVELEPVSSIGSHALFVGHGRGGLSIDADKFPTIQGGCVYFVEPGYHAAADRIIVHVADKVINVEWGCWGNLQGCFRPFTLAKVFADYCRFTDYSELREIMASKWGFSDVDYSESDESSSDEDELSDDEGSSPSELDDEEASSP